MNAGDVTGAFSEFYESEHAEQVRRAVLLIGSQAVAEELVHDAFLGVFTKWGEIDNPGGYLNRSVLHGCRRHGRRRRLVDVGDDGDARLVDVTVVGPENAVVVSELLLTLPFRQRAAIVLRFYARMTENEIAAALDCRPGTVGPAINRGLAKLRGELT